MVNCPTAWSPFYSMDSYERIGVLDDSDEGVYIIITLPTTGGRRIVDVGSGEISDRIAYHLRQNPDWKSTNFAFTWSPLVNTGDYEGVEAYLADKFLLRGTGELRFPDVERIPVDTPFD